MGYFSNIKEHFRIFLSLQNWFIDLIHLRIYVKKWGLENQRRGTPPPLRFSRLKMFKRNLNL